MNLDRLIQNLIQYRLNVQTISHNINACLHASVIIDKQSYLKEVYFWS